MPEQRFVFVKSPFNREVMAFFEHDSRHPDGEVVVKGSEPMKVAFTPQVKRAIDQGRVILIGDAPAPEPEQKPVEGKREELPTRIIPDEAYRA